MVEKQLAKMPKRMNLKRKRFREPQTEEKYQTSMQCQEVYKEYKSRAQTLNP
jgi:hypothetical protein